MSPTAIATESALMESLNSLTAPMAWFSLGVHTALSRTVTTLARAIPAQANNLPVSALFYDDVFIYAITNSFNRRSRRGWNLRLEVRHLRTRIVLHPLLGLLELGSH